MFHELTDVGIMSIIIYTLFVVRRESQEEFVHRINASGGGTLVMKDSQYVNTSSHTCTLHYLEKFLDVICSFKAATRHIHAWKI